MSALVVIAEGDPFNLRMLQQACEEADLEVLSAGDAESALDVIARHRPSLLLLDIAFAGGDPDVLAIVRADPALSRLPVLLTAPADDPDGCRLAIERGADDYVTRPYRVFEVQQRARNLVRMMTAERVAARSDGGASQRLAEAATDALTRAGSDAQLRISLEYEATRAIRYGHGLTCLVLRVANLPAIVDASGPETRDGLLLQLAHNLRTSIRGVDHLFRSDDDELTLLLPETDEEGADRVLARLARMAADGTLCGAGISPAPELHLGRAGIVPGGELADGRGLHRAARADLSPLAPA